MGNEMKQFLANERLFNVKLITLDEQAITNQLFNLITGYFEYEVETSTFSVTKPLEEKFELFLEDQQKQDGFVNITSFITSLDTFLSTDEENFVSDITLFSDNERPLTYILKCTKKIVNEKKMVYGVLIDTLLKDNQLNLDIQLDKLQTLGQLTSGVSHDFNNQLNGILGYVALMKTLTTDSELLRYMEGIERSINHSTKLTRQLLSFSHQTESKKENIDFKEIVSDIKSILEHTVNRRITIDASFDLDDCFVLGDVSALHNAVLNLCLNARDAIVGNGNISLQLEKKEINHLENNMFKTPIEPGEYAVLRISDTGTGIPVELMEKIFQPFFTTKPLGKGTGMGLAAVASTLKEHNGALTIESVLNEGTTFTIYIRNYTTINKKIEAKKIYKSSGSVLLIDDEFCNLEITHTLLESFGYTVTSFCNPEEAIDYYAKHFESIDCILLDVIMPKMSGTEVFEALKLINPKSLVILLTGICEQTEIEFILRHGVEAYVPKPVNQYELSHGVYKVLKQKPYSPAGITIDKLKALDTTLNLDVAIESLGGNVGLYLKVAHKFRKQFYMLGVQLPQIVVEDAELAHRLVHTLKGLASQLGADDLYIYSKELESKISKNKDISTAFAIFHEEFCEVMDELASFETLTISN